jgi:hypothetical protein
MIDAVISILQIILGVVSAVGVAFLGYKAQIKTKKMDIDANTHADAYKRMEEQMAALRDYVKEIAKKVDVKVDGLTDAVNDNNAKWQQAFTTIELLSERVDKHNHVIERTYTNEADIKAIKQHDTDQDRRLEHLEQTKV